METVLRAAGACLPFVGPLIAWNNESSLKQQAVSGITGAIFRGSLNASRDPVVDITGGLDNIVQKARLYSICRIVGDLLTAIAAVALAILCPFIPLLIPVAGVIAGYCLWDAFNQCRDLPDYNTAAAFTGAMRQCVEDSSSSQPEAAAKAPSRGTRSEFGTMPTQDPWAERWSRTHASVSGMPGGFNPGFSGSSWPLFGSPGGINPGLFGSF